MFPSPRYAEVIGWECLPAGYVHADVPDVAVDSKDRVFAIARSDPRVLIYERDGTFVKSWGENRAWGRPHSITIAPDDSVYCVDDRDHTIHKFTPDGGLIMTLGISGVASGTGYVPSGKPLYERLSTITHGGPPFNLPTGIAIAPNGDLYVSDGYGNARVHRFTSDGRLIQSWGEPGIGPGQFHLPHDIGVTGDGRVLVADRQNDRVQVFGLTGEFLEMWTDVQRPAGLYIDRQGLVYVAELPWTKDQRSFVHGVRELPPRFSVFADSGRLVARWEGARSQGGSLSSPHGICADSHGDIYIGQVHESNYSQDQASAPRPLKKFARTG